MTTATNANWMANDYCPASLRTVAAVLAAAKPRKVDGGYRWWRAGGDWYGVVPMKGVVPVEIANRLVGGPIYDTADAALSALRAACEGLKLDGWGREVA